MTEYSSPAGSKAALTRQAGKLEMQIRYRERVIERIQAEIDSRRDSLTRLHAEIDRLEQGAAGD